MHGYLKLETVGSYHGQMQSATQLDGNHKNKGDNVINDVIVA